MTLSLRELTVNFRRPSGEPMPALGPISFDVAEDQFVAIVGPSGCGKSTLIRVLAGLQSATSGKAFYADEPIHRPLPEFAIMFQDANLMPWRTVLDNIALPLEIAGPPPCPALSDRSRAPAPAQSRKLRACLPGPALRRTGATRRPGPGHRPATADLAPRRTLRRPRCPDPRKTRLGAAATSLPLPPNHHHGHA